MLGGVHDSSEHPPDRPTEAKLLLILIWKVNLAKSGGPVKPGLSFVLRISRLSQQRLAGAGIYVRVLIITQFHNFPCVHRALGDLYIASNSAHTNQ